MPYVAVDVTAYRYFQLPDFRCNVFTIMTKSRPWPSFDEVNFAPSLTGFSAPVLEGIYKKYCGPGTNLRGRRDLFSLLKFAKTYPTIRVHADRTGGSKKGFGYDQSKINAQFSYLASVVNELAEPVQRRRESHNRIPRVFSRHVVGSIDTFPLRVQRRKGYMRQRILYQGKYKCHVLKFQAVVDNTGNFLWFSGPHVGSEGDGNLWKKKRPTFLTRNPQEKALGDKAYCGAVFENRLQVIAPFKKPRRGSRTRAQSAYNYIHESQMRACIRIPEAFWDSLATLQGSIESNWSQTCARHHESSDSPLAVQKKLGAIS